MKNILLIGAGRFGRHIATQQSIAAAFLYSALCPESKFIIPSITAAMKIIKTVGLNR